MNKLLTFDGGQPFTTGDIDYIQTCYGEAIEAIGKALTGADVTKAVLWGIEYDGKIQAGHATQGAVMVDGEVLFVPSDLTGTSERYLCFRAVDSEQRTLNNGQQVNVYRKYEAYLSASIDGAYKYIDLTDTDTLYDILRGSRDWVSNASYSFASGASGEFLESKRAAEWLIKSANRSSASDNLLLSKPGSPLPNSWAGIGADTLSNKAIVFIFDGIAVRTYNVDGTEYTGSLTVSNVYIR